MNYSKKIKLFCLVLSLVLTSCGIKKSLQFTPDISGYNQEESSRKKVSDSLYTLKNSFLHKNQFGHWELYAEGDAYEIGKVSGTLTKELIYNQENVFFGKIKEFVPNKTKQKLIRFLLKWYNRKMYQHIIPEYQAELFGVSKSQSDEFDYMVDNFPRLMYLHSSHDLGHAMQDLALVGCSSFSSWGKNTADGQLISARNLDFYAGDDFAKNKIVQVIKPKTGHAFISISWPGMIGVVSGMNEKGICVTINAGKSDLSWSAKTPISLLVREILQYASSINEAKEIAQKREVFVAESILVSSGSENKAIIIEVAPKKIAFYEENKNDEMLCTNHFQSNLYQSDENNLYQIEDSHSMYRMNRLKELLKEKSPLTIGKAVEILRDKNGLANKAIGYGNEKALNQLIAHHGIVFKPSELKCWISASPYQLGSFVEYDLNMILQDKSKTNFKAKETIAADSFLNTEAYKKYEEYRVLDRTVDKAIERKELLDTAFIKKYQSFNPDLWLVYYKIGLMYYNTNCFEAAKIQFNTCLNLEIAYLHNKTDIEKKLKTINERL